MEAARAALAPGAKTPITFIADCRENPHGGRHGFCGRPSVNPRGDADLSLEIRQSPALLIWSNLWGAWLLHPHGFGRSPHTRLHDVMPKDAKWVAGKNHITIAATRLAQKIDFPLCLDEYDKLIAVRLGKIRRTMTPVAGELLARCVFPRGPEPGCAPHKFGPNFPQQGFCLPGSCSGCLTQSTRQAICRGEQILIHCVNGRHRSAQVVATSLSPFFNSVEQALAEAIMV